MNKCRRCNAPHTRKSAFCSQSCSHQRPKLAVTCPTCKKVNLKPAWKANRPYCGNACAKTKAKVPVVCRQCKNTRWYMPSVARRRTYCSPSCASKANRNCSRESCRLGGFEAAKARFSNWWQAMMQRVMQSDATPAEAFRAGYIEGHRRGYKRKKRLVE